MATPAVAEDLRFTTNTKRMVVNQAYENVRWGLAGGDLPLVDSVDVTLEHYATRQLVDFDFDTSRPFGGTFRIYDYERMGAYKVLRSAYDVDFNETTVAATYLRVKYAARSTLTATRSGRSVSLTATTKRYDGGYPLWKNHVKATVVFSSTRRADGEPLRSVRCPPPVSPRSAWPAPKAASYRVLVNETSNAWSAKSRTVRK